MKREPLASEPWNAPEEVLRKVLRNGGGYETAKFAANKAEYGLDNEVLIQAAKHGRCRELGFSEEHRMFQHRFIFKDEDDMEWVLTCATGPQVGVVVLVSIHPPRE